MARQAAAMDRWHDAAGAVERQAARNLPSLAIRACDDPFDNADAILASAMTTDAADRLERHDLARTRAFYRALSKLEELQEKRRGVEGGDEFRIPPPFADESACEAYLAQEFRQGRRPCPKCGSKQGYLLPSAAMLGVRPVQKPGGLPCRNRFCAFKNPFCLAGSRQFDGCFGDPRSITQSLPRGLACSAWRRCVRWRGGSGTHSLRNRRASDLPAWICILLKKRRST